MEMLVLQPTRTCSTGPGMVQRGRDGSSLSLSCRSLAAEHMVRRPGNEAQRVESHDPESPSESPLLDTLPPRQRPALVSATALQRLVASSSPTVA